MDIKITRTNVDASTLEEIAELHCRVWSDAFGRRLQKVRWAFGGNPLGYAPLLLARNGQGEVVGVRGGIPWSVAPVDGVNGSVVQLHGTAIDASVRRRGIFSEMTTQFVDEARRQGIALIFNVSVAASRAGYERLGWVYSDSLQSLFLPLRPIRFAIEMAGGHSRPRPQKSMGLDSAPVYSDIVGVLDARSRRLAGLMHTAYTQEFYEWRFGSGGYSWIGDREDGFVVYRMRPRGNLSELLIGDVWPGKASARQLVWRAVKRERPDLVACWTTVEHPLYRTLRWMGFVSQPGRSLNLGLRRLDGRNLVVDCALMPADIDTF